MSRDSDEGTQQGTRPEAPRRRLGSGAFERLTPMDLLLALAGARTAEEAGRVAETFSQLGAAGDEYRPLVDALCERAEAFERQCALAGLDELTGIANRRGFNDVVQREIVRCRRSGRPLALLVLDLDGLKRINDGRGHLAGDEAIRSVAAACTASIRGGDVAARIGGDEFAIVLPETNAAQCRVVASRIRRRLASDPARMPGLGVSIGHAVLSADSQETGEHPSDGAGAVEATMAELLHRADLSMYADKRGRTA